MTSASAAPMSLPLPGSPSLLRYNQRVVFCDGFQIFQIEQYLSYRPLESFKGEWQTLITHGTLDSHLLVFYEKEVGCSQAVMYNQASPGLENQCGCPGVDLPARMKMGLNWDPGTVWVLLSSVGWD